MRPNVSLPLRQLNVLLTLWATRTGQKVTLDDLGATLFHDVFPSSEESAHIVCTPVAQDFFQHFFPGFHARIDDPNTDAWAGVGKGSCSWAPSRIFGIAP